MTFLEVSAFEKTFGGRKFDESFSVRQTNDGGYILAGVTEPFGSRDENVYLVKLDEFGVKEWERTFGGEKSDKAYSVLQADDGGYVIAGETESKGSGGVDVYLIKVDSSGKAEWEKTFGGSMSDRVFSITHTRSGGYVVAGYTTSKGAGGNDVYVIKLDERGNLEWEKTFGGKGNEVAHSISVTDDGGFIVAGYSAGLKEDDFGQNTCNIYVIKIDSVGEQEWCKTFGSRRYDEEAWSVLQNADGDFIVAGMKGVVKQSIYLVKIGRNGVKKWERTYSIDENSKSYSLALMNDGKYVVAGTVQRFFSEREITPSDAFLLKLSSVGRILSLKRFGGNEYDLFRSVATTRDGGLVMAGGTASKGAGEMDVYVVKLNERWEVGQTFPMKGIVVKSGVRVRASPNTSGEVLGYLEKGNSVKVVGKGKSKVKIGKGNDYWYKIETKSGLKCWLYGYFLDLD